jgi:hypothetical protein
VETIISATHVRPRLFVNLFRVTEPESEFKLRQHSPETGTYCFYRNKRKKKEGRERKDSGLARIIKKHVK